MTKRLVFYLLLAVLTTISGAALADGDATSKHSVSELQRREIRFQRYTNPKWSVIEVKRTIRTAVKRWPVPGGVSTAIAVARCESGLFWHATSSSGTFRGIFQQHAGYWPARQNHYDSRRWHLAESPYNVRSNVIVSIRMAHGGGWGAWSCA